MYTAAEWMDFNEVQPSKTHASMEYSSELGSTMLFRERQPLKAPSPIRVTEFGMTMLSREQQPLKAPDPMYVTESGMSMLSRERQS